MVDTDISILAEANPDIAKRQILYVEAPAGSGKTTATIKHTVDLILQRRKVMIAVNTIALAREIETKLLKLLPRSQVTRIDGNGKKSARVVSKVEAHIQNADPMMPQVLIVQQVTLLRLSRNNRKFWDLFIDEIPSAFKQVPFQIGSSHEVVTKHLGIEAMSEHIGRLVVKDREAIDEFKQNKNKDQFIKDFVDLFHDVDNPDRVVLVQVADWNDLTTNPETKGHINFYSILSSTFVDGFNTVTFMGANASSTDLFVMWAALDRVEWVPNDYIQNQLQYREHGPDTSRRLTIKYVFERDWAINQADSDFENGTKLDAVAELIKTEFDGCTFLWHANKSVSDTLMPRQTALRLPMMPHGIDDPTYRATHRVALLAAQNYRSATYPFLERLGVSEYQSRVMMTYQLEYQTVMRCSLRDPNATTPVVVIVMSRGSADWLALRFPGCKIEKLEHDIPEPRRRGSEPQGERAMSPAEKQKRYRESQKAKKALKAKLAQHN